MDEEMIGNLYDWGIFYEVGKGRKRRGGICKYTTRSSDLSTRQIVEIFNYVKESRGSEAIIFSIVPLPIKHTG